MAFKIQPSQLSGSAGLVPSVVNPVLAAAQVFERGTPVRLDASGEIEEHPLVAVVVDIFGFSLMETLVTTSNDPLATLGTITVAKADRNTAFVSRAATAGAETDDISAVNLGDQFGLIKVGNDFFVDLDDVVNVVLQIVKIASGTLTSAEGLNLLWWKVLESALQEP